MVDDENCFHALVALKALQGLLNLAGCLQDRNPGSVSATRRDRTGDTRLFVASHCCFDANSWVHLVIDLTMAVLWSAVAAALPLPAAFVLHSSKCEEQGQLFCFLLLHVMDRRISSTRSA